MSGPPNSYPGAPPRGCAETVLIAGLLSVVAFLIALAHYA